MVWIAFLPVWLWLCWIKIIIHKILSLETSIKYRFNYYKVQNRSHWLPCLVDTIASFRSSCISLKVQIWNSSNREYFLELEIWVLANWGQRWSAAKHVNRFSIIQISVLISLVLEASMLYGNGTSRSCLKLQYWSLCWNGINNLSQLAARDVITKAYFVLKQRDREK